MLQYFWAAPPIARHVPLFHPSQAPISASANKPSQNTHPSDLHLLRRRLHGNPPLSILPLHAQIVPATASGAMATLDALLHHGTSSRDLL